MVVLHRVLCVVHFVLLCVALGLNAFASVAFTTAEESAEEIAGYIGNFVAEVVAFTTPAFLLAANAGNAGFTGSVKVVTVLYFIIVEISIFLTFWIGYSPVFYNPLVSADWQATQIAALVFITLDFVVVLVLIVLSVCTQTATSLDTTRKVSGIAVIGLIVQLICLFVILGIFYIWQGVLEVVVPGFSTTQITTTIVNATTTATTIAATTTPAIGIPELVLRNVGQFVALGVWTSPGVLLVIRSREGGMLAQDVLWNIVSIITQVFNLIMAVFISLGSKAHIYAAAAIAVSFGCFYALDLILLFVLTFKLKAKEEVWDRSNEYLYNAPR